MAALDRHASSADSEGVLSCAVLALVGLAGAVVVRWTRRPVDGLGRRRPFLAVSVGLSLALAVGGTVPVLQHHRLETRLSAVASALVGAPSEVRCQSLGRQLADLGSDLGSVRSGPDGVPERRTFVERDPCRELAAYLGGDRSRPTRDQVVAVHVLTHETRHVAGVTTENAAECGAVQRDAVTARLLGATAEQAVALARSHWTTTYPRMPDAYRDGGCAPGGTLDEHLAAAPWTPVSGR
ncbi:hypothetical protein [Angustibacter aerolatus]